VFALNSSGVVTRTAILTRSPFPAERYSAELKTEAVRELLNLDSMATIHGISQQGLVSYSVELFRTSRTAKYWEASVSRYHFGIIRGIYHEHIYHHEGDFLLRPVDANSPPDALEGICKQYISMVMAHHEKMKAYIRMHYSCGLVTYYKYVLAMRFASHAQGNMAYCAHFHRLFEKNGHQDGLEPGMTFAAATQSLCLLEKELKTISDSKLVSSAQGALFGLSLIALGFSVFAATTMLQNRCEISMSIGVRLLCGCGAVIVYWVLYCILNKALRGRQKLTQEAKV
jgi:hypothetical protein